MRLPAVFGNWKHVHKSFTRWAGSGNWERFLQAPPEDTDNDTRCLIPPAIQFGKANRVSGTGSPELLPTLRPVWNILRPWNLRQWSPTKNQADEFQGSLLASRIHAGPNQADAEVP
jgi:hypothetical protein